jgi:hypothetical protein
LYVAPKTPLGNAQELASKLTTFVPSSEAHVMEVVVSLRAKFTYVLQRHVWSARTNAWNAAVLAARFAFGTIVYPPLPLWLTKRTGYRTPPEETVSSAYGIVSTSGEVTVSFAAVITWNVPVPAWVGTITRISVSVH